VPLGEAVSLLRKVESLHPSVHDERLSLLVQHVVSQKTDLSLTSLVDVAVSIQAMGFHRELVGLMDLIVENASFLSGDVMVSFAKTIAIASQRDPQALSSRARSAVMRILGEHVLEGSFEEQPEKLAEALLSIASFYCSRAGAPDSVLSQPWHHGAFAACVDPLAVRAAWLPPKSLSKCLRAYKLLLLSGPLSSTSPEAVAGAIEGMPSILASALAGRLAEIQARDVARAFHAMASLHKHGLQLDEQGRHFCRVAAQDLEERRAELSLTDVCYLTQSLAFLGEELQGGSAKLLSALYEEVQRHIPSMTSRDVLLLARSASKLPRGSTPGVVQELIAAELLRELRSLRPMQLCDAAVSFTRLRYGGIGLFQGLAQASVTQMEDFSPRQLATMLHSLAKAGMHESRFYEYAAVQVPRTLLASEPRDLALVAWAFAKALHRNEPMLSSLQEDIKRRHTSNMTPADVSMILWSFTRLEVALDEELLGSLTHFVATGSRSFSSSAIIVTCLSFARLGFAQQPVLVELYRTLYAKLPRLNHHQLAFGFFLFSTSGVRDEPLLQRFLFECRQRIAELRGQDLGNILLACSKVVTPAAFEQSMGLRDGLRKQIFEHIDRLPPVPLLSVYLSAPPLLGFSTDENLQVMAALSKQFPDMAGSELARCLLATARLELVHKPFLLPLFNELRWKRRELDANEVVSCIWSVYTLGYCKPKFRRMLGTRLTISVSKRDIPARTLRDILPALSHLGYWERLPDSLRRSVWRLADEDLRQCATPPPSTPTVPRDLQSEEWRLPSLEKGLFRKRLRRGEHVFSKEHMLENMLPDSRKEAKREKKEEKKILTEAGVLPTGQTAVKDFITMVQRL